MKTCENCNDRLNCYYRGIINPCDNWVANSEIKSLQQMAKRLINKPMSFEEGQFITGCTTLESFSPKQASWLRSIGARLL
jgi:hypothetical protein